MKKVWIIFICIFFLLVTPTALVLAQEQGYSVIGSVTVVGGTQRFSEHFSVQDMIGATAAGGLESTNFHVESGGPVHDPLNNPPVANAGGPYLVSVGATIPLTGSGSDPDGDPLTYYMWAQSPNLGTFAYTQGYANPTYTAGSSVGIGELTMAVDDGILQDSATTLVVIYDPSAGFVTGGGWITSPVGAYLPDPSLTGKAIFGFVAKYQKGATVPTGKTEFQFKVASLNFHSDSYQWLVVAGAKAQYKGVGAINGAGEYGFMLTAIDGQISGGGGVDKFRIKIWDKATGQVIYDNKLGEAEDSSAATNLGGGSIVIHN